MIVELLILLLLAVVVALLLHLLFQVRAVRTRIEEMPKSDPSAPFAQLEAYLYLRDRLDLKQGLPYTPFWSAAPDFLKLIADHCLEARPATIVECSSGLTTLVLARCCEVNGRGRVFDNILVERLWRTVKYEDLYLKEYETVRGLRRGLEDYFHFYCFERFHQSLDYRTPWDVYQEGLTRSEQRRFKTFRKCAE